jgi:MSHA biogenesis protein MshM
MYLSHFGLDEPPFRITPHTDFFFDGANRGATLEALLYAIIHDEGIVKVSGEVGSGKTMLCRVLMERLPKNVDIIYLSNPSLARDEILLAIAEELKLSVGARRPALVLRALQDHLIKVYADGRQVVVLIDEAHAMPLETLEEIRLLSNLESSRHKLLQIVLFGQPELDDNLNIPQMRQLKERITHSFRLEPLIRDDIAQYLVFRMRAAGYRGPDIFTPAAIRSLTKASRGLTRRVNILADKSLLAAFSQNTHQVTARLVRIAIRDSEFYRARPRPRTAWIVAAAVAAGIAIGGVGLRFIWPDAPVAKPPAASNNAAPAIIAPLVSAPAVPAAAIRPAAVPVPEAATPVRVPADADAPAVDAAAPGPLTRERMAATEAWLRNAPGSAFAVQVMTLAPGNEREIEAFLMRADKLTGLNDVYLYQTRIKGQVKPALAVVYGSYPTRDKVREAIAGFPEELRAHLPYLRTVNGIRREIAERDPKTAHAG